MSVAEAVRILVTGCAQEVRTWWARRRLDAAWAREKRAAVRLMDARAARRAAGARTVREAHRLQDSVHDLERLQAAADARRR